MVFRQFLSAKKQVCERTGSFTKTFANASIFFPAANVCNFMQGANPLASKIAVANLLYSLLLVGASTFLKNLPENSQAKQILKDVGNFISDKTPTKNPLKVAFRLVGRELSNPLRVTSYSALAIGGLLLTSAAVGSGVALFPGLAAVFFGVGNYIQSSPTIARFRDNPKINPAVMALTHPAVWYGVGYAMTGIGIGGGLSLLANPLKNIAATLFTSVGIAETAGALGLMTSGKVKNQAAPFVGVAVGTAIFAATGLVTGNLLGAATGLFACAGELSLATLMQKIHNDRVKNLGEVAPASKIEDLATAPIRAAMKRGWISPTLESA